MIGKVSMGAGAARVIEYCLLEKGKGGERVERGELIYSNEVWESRHPNGQLNIASLAQQLKDVAALNAKTDKFVWHQTFSFPPGEQVSNETMIRIARDFAKDFGFEDNQYLVFRHRDKPHEHFHIVANRIDGNGKNTATDQHNYERIQVFSRKMEQKYNLTPVENHRQKVDVKHNLEDKQLEKLRKLLDTLLPHHRTLSELSIALKKKGVIVNLGRGISFTDGRTGITFKGSDVGREYSRSGIEKSLGRAVSSAEKKQRADYDGDKRAAMRETVDLVLLQTKPYNFRSPKEVQPRLREASWKDFGDRLSKEGVTLKLIRDDKTGGVKGAAFLLGERRYVNSRELGEMYTIRNLALRFGRTPEEFQKILTQLENPKGKEKKALAEFIKELPAEAPTRFVATANAASETNKDLAKIAEAQRSVEPKKLRRRLK